MGGGSGSIQHCHRHRPATMLTKRGRGAYSTPRLVARPRRPSGRNGALSDISPPPPKGGPDLHAKAEAGGAGAGRQRKSATTLGDVLYARSKARVPEQDWAALIQSIAAGDQLALHALYERAHRMVFTLVMRITANRETAEELTIDCSMTCGGVRRVTTRPTALCSAGS